MSWRNVLRLDGLPWLRGHTFQGQVLFPGAGHASLAVQAATVFASARDHTHRLVEIRDLNILKAIVIEENGKTNGVETIFTVRSREGKESIGSGRIAAEFDCYTCVDGKTRRTRRGSWSCI